MEMGRKMSITNMDIKPGQSFRAKSSRMTKFVEFWGADKPFANITDNKMAKTIAIAVCITKCLYIFIYIIIHRTITT